ncbi:hypothetical protein HUJ05_007738 [Dendroctonus ponderosae]|nr:hypothetical protein HUJ05_007738 [Dendroctonus ponderosae]
MENEAGEFVDLYWPRKCSASNRIIHAKDHASIQISFAEVDPVTGRMTDNSKSYALCGAIRRMGESDDCIVRLAKRDGLIAKEIAGIVKCLKRRKAPDKDGITNVMLKNLPQKGIVAITNLINAVLRTRHFSTSWKQADTHV